MMTFYSKLATRQPRIRWRRYVRALWRDARALCHEFRGPILIFLITVIVGGYVYGELYHHARGVAIALIDRPYIMMELMITQPPGDVPPEWYLVLFWYFLPVVFVFIVGLGAADFVHLVFSPDERRDSWREAVASTYRNHIIVLGAGHVGSRVIRALIEMGQEVVAMDKSPDPGVEEVLQELKVPLIIGDGRVSSTLEKAGLREARSLVICTGNDHINLEVIMQARDMNPALRIIVRVWDDRYANQIARFMNVQAVISSSDLAAPAFAGAALGIEITQIMRVGDEEYSTTHLTVEPGSFLDGETVGQLQREEDIDIVLHSRGSQSDVQPKHDVVVQAGDTLVIFARHKTILKIVTRNRPGKRRAK